MTTKTKKKIGNVHYDVCWKSDLRKSEYITLAVCTDLEEAIKVIRSKCTHTGTDDFRVYEVKVGQSPKLVIDHDLRNYAF